MHIHIYMKSIVVPVLESPRMRFWNQLFVGRAYIWVWRGAEVRG
jgi:hypothetical protein